MAVTTAAALLALAACGSSARSTSSGSSTTGAASSTGSAGAAGSVNAYIAAVQALEKPVQSADSAYFHTSSASGAQHTATTRLRAAYAAAAAGLARLTPPAAGASQHRQLLAEWQAAAADLDKVLASRPFSPTRAYSTVQAHSDRQYQLAAAIYTIP